MGPVHISACNRRGGRAEWRPMFRRTHITLPLVAGLFAGLLLASCVTVPPGGFRLPLTFLRVEDGRTVDGHGRPVALKGCNLGNWLLLEMWMLGINEIPDQYSFEGILAERFGAEKKNELMETYRANWIAERDFPIIRSFGLNCVRLPFHYNLLMDDAKPYELKPGAFKWLDAAVRMASSQGLYVIPDLHGAPGGQSMDHIVGRRDQNKLWGNEEYLKQTVWLWRQIAEHYKDEPAIAAYDLLNEPFGDGQTDQHVAPLVKLMDDCYKAIREVDPRHILIFPSWQKGLMCYGNPADHGWTNLMFTDHYYQGVMWGGATLQAHQYFMNRVIPHAAAYLESLRTPLLVGEFNVVFGFTGGATLMRQYYDLYASKGWWATMWSYKLLGGPSKNPWYLVTSQEKTPPLNIRTATYEDVRAWFERMGTMEYAYNDDLRQAMTARTPGHIYLERPVPPMKPPFQDNPAPWQGTDISSQPAGGERVYAVNAMDIYGGGRDLWGAQDEFRFVWQKVSGDFELEATVESLDEIFDFTKAGLMIRGGLESNAPLVLLHVFPSSQTVLAWREAAGGRLEEKKLAIREFPVRLRLKKAGTQVTAAFAVGNGGWTEAGSLSFNWLGSDVYAGMAVLSHDDRYLTRAVFRDITLRKETP